MKCFSRHVPLAHRCFPQYMLMSVRSGPSLAVDRCRCRCMLIVLAAYGANRRKLGLDQISNFPKIASKANLINIKSQQNAKTNKLNHHHHHHQHNRHHHHHHHHPPPSSSPKPFGSSMPVVIVNVVMLRCPGFDFVAVEVSLCPFICLPLISLASSSSSSSSSPASSFYRHDCYNRHYRHRRCC